MNIDEIKKRLDDIETNNEVFFQRYPPLHPELIGRMKWLISTLREALKELEQIRKGADQFEDALNELSGINSLDEESES